MKTTIALLVLITAACAAPEPSTTATTGTIAATGTTATTATATPVDDGRRRLMPIDEASQDPSFLAYREKLLGVLKAKDTTALQPFVDPKIRTTFGEGGGWDDFTKQWKLPSSDSRLWTELTTILGHGGSFEEVMGVRRFCAPYVYSDWPEDLDSFEYLAVIGDDVPLYENASAESKVVATLDHEIVRAVEGMGGGEFRHVELSDKKQGWIRRDQARSPIEYRACFTKASGQWRMNLLVAGD
jgi:hypothetical protein